MRYTPTYREDEIGLICRFAARGESVCFVGLVGVGKSNIVKYLSEERDGKMRYLQEKVDKVHLAVVDATTWKRTARHLWRLMLDGMEVATASLPARPPSNEKIIALSEEERLRRSVQQGINWICQELGDNLVFVLDDFDDVFSVGPLPLLEQLNAFRSAGNREKLSYVVFTKKLPHVLGRAFDLRIKSKFYDLFKFNIYLLGPYNHQDAQQMVRHLNELAGHPLGRQALAQIEWLSGGHSRLIKTIFETWLKETPTSDDLVDFFEAKPDVRGECQRVLAGLHAQERAVLERLARNHLRPEDNATVDHLARRGVLDLSRGVTWFSPVFLAYVRSIEEG